MAPKLKCKGCGCTEFHRDIHSASSDLACEKCGRVYEENPIVSEVTFGETSNGAAVVQGAFVGSDQAHATFAGGPRGNSVDSRTKTLASAKRKIRAVASALRIPEYVSDAAYQWFSLALANNFVKGRRSQNVVAACLYIACRKEKTHHMLIDFSSRLQISVYSVGATFLKMVKVLHITKLPLADPSLFIQHFAEKLEFGDDKLKIVKDAVKLAQRMADDWIHEGRRPAGIAGACLLLAARMNNHRRTHAEIVAIAHVGEDTIQRRLNEFKKTNAASLTISEFREAENIESSIPPSFRANRTRDLTLKHALHQKINENEDEKLVKSLFDNIDLQTEEIVEQLNRVRKRQQQDLSRKLASTNLQREDQTKNTNGLNEEDDDYTGSMIAINRRFRKNYEKDLEESLKPTEGAAVDINRPKNLHKLATTEEVLSKIASHETDFDDIDDLEIESFILTAEESSLKERIWVSINEDYLLNQEQKRLKAEADEISGHHQPKRRRKPKSENKLEELENDAIQYALDNIGEGDGSSSSSAAVAARMLKKKAASKKINYTALNSLFDDDS